MQIPNANLPFSCSSYDNLKFSRNFEILSIIKKLRVLSYGIFCSIHKTITRNLSEHESWLPPCEVSPYNRSGWYVYHYRCNCPWFFTNYKYLRYRTLGDRQDIEHLSSEVGLGPQPVCLLSYMVMHMRALTI